ncbi:hypothetical protein [Bradyrhizobium sp. BR 1433]|uniref:hypothetical protein n=1 Tax=Bradyrhizobium sp. BR 1433 TaxID=3447967 RepID=UPI003EE50825
MINVTRRALRVYAALNELRGNENDVLDALIPFFEPILALMNRTVFDSYVFSVGVCTGGASQATLLPRSSPSRAQGHPEAAGAGRQ